MFLKERQIATLVFLFRPLPFCAPFSQFFFRHKQVQFSIGYIES